MSARGERYGDMASKLKNIWVFAAGYSAAEKNEAGRPFGGGAKEMKLIKYGWLAHAYKIIGVCQSM